MKTKPVNQFLLLALRQGAIVTIHEVENGLNANCRCAGCGAQLVAKNNPANRKEAHFAHHGVTDCATAVESALHRLAKEVLFREKQCWLPAFQQEGPTGSCTYTQPTLVRFETVELEKGLRDGPAHIIADACGHTGGRTLIIEFAHTHFVDEEKRQKIRQANRACVEVDLRGLPQRREAVRSVLLQASDRVRWIHNPRGEEQCRQHWHRHQQEQLAAEEEKRRRLTQYKADGYLVIPHHNESKFFCPARKEIREGFFLSSYGNPPVLKQIAAGRKWNGKFYGFPPDGSHIYLDQELVPVWDACDLPEERFLYKCLRKLSALRRQLATRPCHHCRCLKDTIDGFTICGFRRAPPRPSDRFYDYDALFDDRAPRSRSRWYGDDE